jgi:hypothetical protein
MFPSVMLEHRPPIRFAARFDLSTRHAHMTLTPSAKTPRVA